MLEAARRRPSRRGSGRRRRLALLTPLLAAVSLALLAGPVSAAPGAVGRPAGDDQLPEPAGTGHSGGRHGRQLRRPDGHQGPRRRDAQR